MDVQPAQLEVWQLTEEQQQSRTAVSSSPDGGHKTGTQVNEYSVSSSVEESVVIDSLKSFQIL